MCLSFDTPPLDEIWQGYTNIGVNQLPWCFLI